MENLPFFVGHTDVSKIFLKISVFRSFGVNYPNFLLGNYPFTVYYNNLGSLFETPYTENYRDFFWIACSTRP